MKCLYALVDFANVRLLMLILVIYLCNMLPAVVSDLILYGFCNFCIIIINIITICIAQMEEMIAA